MLVLKTIKASSCLAVSAVTPLVKGINILAIIPYIPKIYAAGVEVYNRLNNKDNNGNAIPKAKK